MRILWLIRRLFGREKRTLGILCSDGHEFYTTTERCASYFEVLIRADRRLAQTMRAQMLKWREMRRTGLPTDDPEFSHMNAWL